MIKNNQIQLIPSRRLSNGNWQIFKSDIGDKWQVWDRIFLQEVWPCMVTAHKVIESYLRKFETENIYLVKTRKFPVLTALIGSTALWQNELRVQK